MEMLARPAFSREHLLVAMEIERLILNNRATKRHEAEKYSQMTHESSDISRLKDWVGYLMDLPSEALERSCE